MNPLIIAIDTADIEHAQHLMRLTEPYCGMFKFGLEFFTAHGQRGVDYMGNPFFLDLKYHDIPSTVGKAVKAALPMMPYMLTVHASGGADMIKAARDAAGSDKNRPLIIAVTVLTSTPYAMEALELAVDAMAAGADGVVCSGWEVADLRKLLGKEAKLVVPGIREAPLPRIAGDDQVRTTTPTRAMMDGADWLVVGRPITESAHPEQTARLFADAATLWSYPMRAQISPRTQTRLKAEE